MIYAILWHDTKELLDAKTFHKYWKNYGSGAGLYGWRPPKKVYVSIGAAKNGMRYVPKQIKHLVGIYTLIAGDPVET